MAKRQTHAKIDSPFAKTEPGPTPGAGGASEDIPATGRTLPTAVGLKESEIELLDDIAADLGIARNAVMRWALRWFLKEYRAGRVPMAKSVKTPEPKNVIEMP